MPHPEAARLSFELVTALTDDSPDNAVMPDNISGFLTILDEFATTAGTIQEQQHPRARRAEAYSVEKYDSAYILMFAIDLDFFSSPVIYRGKTAIDLIPGLHKRLVYWVKTSQVQESIGKVFFVCLQRMLTYFHY